VLDKIIKFSIKNKIVIGIMTLLLIIWGVWSAQTSMRTGHYKNQVQVFTSCPTLAWQEVEQLFTFQI
jgi:cobalt-zinc-cadmium resistance protein CzcA